MASSTSSSPSRLPEQSSREAGAYGLRLSGPSCYLWAVVALNGVKGPTYVLLLSDAELFQWAWVVADFQTDRFLKRTSASVSGS